MALAANSTIVSLRTSTLNSLSRIPLSKLSSVNQFSCKSNNILLQNNCQLLRRTLPIALLAKTSLSDVDLANLDSSTSSDCKLLFISFSALRTYICIFIGRNHLYNLIVYAFFFFPDFHE